jgi:biopolymer transport protein ExbD
MGKKRKTGEINSSSMADIAFLLLIFFLVTTSMSTTTGLPRQLPPPLLDPDAPPPDVNKRNLFVVKINSQNQMLIQGEELPLTVLREKVKEFVKNVNNDPGYPELKPVQIPLLGEMMITKDHVISLQNDRDTQFQAYMSVQNELVAAYNELRNEISKQKFGKLFTELSEEEQDAVKKVYPMKISEAEPKNYGGTK